VSWVVIRDVLNAVVAALVDLASVADLVAESECPSNGEAEAARIPAQDWTTRQGTGAHWTVRADPTTQIGSRRTRSAHVARTKGTVRAEIRGS
jgi:hypothetical protein